MGKDQREDFLKKMRILSMIKGRLIDMGRDPGAIEKIMIDEFDGRQDPVISGMMDHLEPDDGEGFERLMEKVKERLD
ncbi:MAG: hypothetical protein R6V01_09935 [Thermoplasmatota archaeon]